MAKGAGGKAKGGHRGSQVHKPHRIHTTRHAKGAKGVKGFVWTSQGFQETTR
jgi:hypothetical protein